MWAELPQHTRLPTAMRVRGFRGLRARNGQQIQSVGAVVLAIALALTR